MCGQVDRAWIWDVLNSRFPSGMTDRNARAKTTTRRRQKQVLRFAQDDNATGLLTFLLFVGQEAVDVYFFFGAYVDSAVYDNGDVEAEG